MDLLRYYSSDGNLGRVTVEELKDFLSDSSKKNDLADFIYLRHYHRYIKPFEFISEKLILNTNTSKEVDEYSLIYKNGFSIMANCCLLIETLESFYRGWDNTQGKSELAFLKFFTRDKNFKELSSGDFPTIFYKNIRCGILHQGETTDGWSISRRGERFIDFQDKKIDSFIFLRKVKASLNDYKRELEDADWNDDIWKNAKKKLKTIIKNTTKI